MSVPKRFNTTLGDLIVAVTDEVAPVAGDRQATNALVSYILQDLFSKRRLRLLSHTTARSARGAAG